MSRIGKIARLPHDIREQLNRRIRDGQSGSQILPWVNELPECRQMLAERFGGHPIDDSNLSDWRHGGYEEWLWHEDRCYRLQATFEYLGKLGAAGDASQAAENLGTLVAAELARALNMLEAYPDINDRWDRLREICRVLSRFRRENYHHQRLRLEEQRCQSERQRQNERSQHDKTTETKEQTPANTIPLNSANSR